VLAGAIRKAKCGLRPTELHGESDPHSLKWPPSPRGCGVPQQGTPGPKSSGLGFECLQGPWDPKGGELYRSTVKPWETGVEAGRCSDVQIV